MTKSAGWLTCEDGFYDSAQRSNAKILLSRKRESHSADGTLSTESVRRIPAPTTPRRSVARATVGRGTAPIAVEVPRLGPAKGPARRIKLGLTLSEARFP